MQKIIIYGHLGRDPEAKTVGEKALSKFSVAVNEGRDRVTWFEVEAWEKTGELCNQYLSKGSGVICEGRMKANTVEKEGKKITYWSMVADRVTFTAKAEKPAAPVAAEGFGDDSDIPF